MSQVVLLRSAAAMLALNRITPLGCASVVLMLMTCLAASPTNRDSDNEELGIVERSGSYSLDKLGDHEFDAEHPTVR